MKIKIPNYLLELDEKEYIKKGSDSIRVYHIGYIIKKIYSELKEFKSIEIIENESKRCHQTYSGWILERGGTSIQDLYRILQYWKVTCKKTDKDLENLWEEIYSISNYFGCVNGKRVKLPKYLDNQLSYLLGVIMGDGHLANPNKSYDRLTSYNSELRITDGHKETFVKLSKIFEELFGYKPKIYSELSKTNKPFYRFVIRSKPIHRFLMNICQIPTGKKYDKTDIPKIIKDSPLEIQKSFIVGFFDADGCLRLHREKFPMVTISQLNPQILYSIIEVSKMLNIKWSGPYRSNHPRNKGYQIKITNKENLERFLKEFPSLNPIKIKQSGILWKMLNPRLISPSKWMVIEGGEQKTKETLSRDTSKVQKL